MAGLFPLAGFWNKDELLLTTFDNQNIFVYLAVLVSVLITALYMTRLVLLVFTGKPRNEHVYEHAHEPGPAMKLPLVLLGVLTVVAGFVVFDGVGRLMGFPGGFGEFLFTHEPEAFHINAGVTASSIALVLVGIAGGFYFWGGAAERAKAVGRGDAAGLHAAAQQVLHGRRLPVGHRPRRAGRGGRRLLVRPRRRQRHRRERPGRR